MKYEEALEVCSQLKELLGDAPGKNDRALRESSDLLSQLGSIQGIGIDANVGIYRRKLDIYFSDKKWMKYPEIKQQSLRALKGIKAVVEEGRESF